MTDRTPTPRVAQPSGPPFRARYPSTCVVTGQRIYRGARVVAVHVDDQPKRYALAGTIRPDEQRCAACWSRILVRYGAWQPPNYRRRAILPPVCPNPECPDRTEDPDR